MRFEAIVMGASAGGVEAWTEILPALSNSLPVPVIIVQHISPDSDNYLPEHFNGISQISVKEAEEKEELKPSNVYFCPPNYHILIEDDRTISLSTETKVNYSRPSIDVLFESASLVFGPGLIGVLLTGSNTDGSKGLKYIQERGGICIVENPQTAKVRNMPESAIKICKPEHVLSLKMIVPLISNLLNTR